MALACLLQLSARDCPAAKPGPAANLPPSRQNLAFAVFLLRHAGPGAPVLIGCMRRALAEWNITVRAWPAPPPRPPGAASQASAARGHPLPTLTLPGA